MLVRPTAVLGDGIPLPAVTADGHSYLHVAAALIITFSAASVNYQGRNNVDFSSFDAVGWAIGRTSSL